MIPISDKMKSYLDSPVRLEGQYIRCVITSKKGNKSYEVSDSDFVSGSIVINRKSVSGSSFDIGECYIGDIKFSITDRLGISEIGLSGGTIDVFFGVSNASISLNEEFQIGSFIIPTEVTRRRDILDITGDSILSKFYKPTNGVATQGFLYNLVTWCCDMCGVVFSMTELEFNSLSPNTALTYYISKESSIESYLDIIMYVAQLIGGFASDTPDGKLVFKSYKAGVSPVEINNDVIASSKIGDESHRIDSISMAFDEENVLISDGDVTDYLLELDPNPLLDNLTTDLRKVVLGNIWNTLSILDLRSFSFDFNGNPAIECGDTIGVSKRGLVSFATDSSWGYHKKCKLIGAGLDKRTKTKSQAVKKAGSGGGSGGTKGNLNIIKYINSKKYSISSTKVNIVTLYFVLPANSSPLININVIGNVESDALVSLELMYDNVVQLIKPKYNLQMGYHTLSFSHSCDAVDTEMQHIFKVAMSCSSQIDISEYDIECSVVGWDIISSKPVWTGIYDLAEEVSNVSVDKTNIGIQAFDETVRDVLE